MLSVALTRHPVSTLTPAPAVPALERSPNLNPPLAMPTRRDALISFGLGVTLTSARGEVTRFDCGNRKDGRPYKFGFTATARATLTDAWREKRVSDVLGGLEIDWAHIESHNGEHNSRGIISPIFFALEQLFNSAAPFRASTTAEADRPKPTQRVTVLLRGGGLIIVSDYVTEIEIIRDFDRGFVSSSDSPFPWRVRSEQTPADRESVLKSRLLRKAP